MITQVPALAGLAIAGLAIARLTTARLALARLAIAQPVSAADLAADGAAVTLFGCIGAWSVCLFNFSWTWTTVQTFTNLA